MNQQKFILRKRHFLLQATSSILILATLACSAIGALPENSGIVVRNLLPTLTPTPLASIEVAAPLVEPSQFDTASSIQADSSSTTPVTTEAKQTLLPPFPPTATSTPASGQESPSIAQPTTTLLATPTSTSITLPEPVVTLTNPKPAEPAIPTVTATASASFEPSGWSFADIRTFSDQENNSLILFGNVVNNTGATQELELVSGNFYDGQGQLIATKDSTVDYWPIDIVPAGERLPFELTVLGIQSAANFELNVEAQANNQILQQSFEFVDVDQRLEEDYYCLFGGLQTTGNPLQEYAVIVAVLYDQDDNVVQFGESFVADVESLHNNNQSTDFEICLELIEQEVARYQLHAWGQ